MEKLDLKTPNFTNENIGKIAELFPNCVTEKKNESGDLERSIDFDTLRQELSGSIVEGSQERYSLNWPGKREALVTANTPISKTLRPCRDESVDFDNTKNIFIEGDNLDVLKLLQETYLSKIKMIYIDPPYNTGNDFIYNDNFTANKEEFDEVSGQRDEEGGRLVANPDSNGRFHSDWLSMMYPRLKLARNLLCDDGVIFISIDDNELANLKKICDEIFGADSFVAQIAWYKKVSPSNDSKWFSNDCDQILVYAKNKEIWRPNRLPKDARQLSYYKNPDNDDRGVWNSSTYTCNKSRQERPNLYYEIINPNTGVGIFPSEEAVWAYSKNQCDQHLKNNLLYWGKNGESSKPRFKKFLDLNQGVVPRTMWHYKEVGSTQTATKELAEILKPSIFQTPKPMGVLKRIIQLSTSDDDIILDFFGGSGSTAQAIFDINLEQSLSRKLLLVQLDEECDKSSAAFHEGYKNIAEISKERIRRAGKKIKEENTDKEGVENLDTGFRVFKIDSSNMVDVHVTPDNTELKNMEMFVENIKEDRSSEDLLFQVLLDWGVDLSLPIIREEIAGKEVFFVDGNALVACFDEGINEEFVTELATRKPLRVVFRDDGFGTGKDGDSVKINVEQVFKLKSPATDIKVI